MQVVFYDEVVDLYNHYASRTLKKLNQHGSTRSLNIK